MEFVPSGTVRMHSATEQVNTNVAKSDAAKRVALQNMPDELDRRFFNPNLPNILRIKKLDSGSKISLLRPTGPYSPEALMVVAKGPDSLSKTVPFLDTEIVATQTIYDLPIDAQTEYFKTIFGGLHAMHMRSREDGTQDPYIFATENNISTVTSPKVRTSRSVALPHTQIVRFHRGMIAESDGPSFPHLKAERKILETTNFFSECASGIHERLLATGLIHSDMSTSDKSPYGYGFSLSPEASASDIQVVMSTHHEAYSEMAQDVLSRLPQRHVDRMVPQPSYRTYFSLGEDLAPRVFMSPVVRSHAGVIESAGIEFSRHPSHPQHMTPEDVAAFHSGVLPLIDFYGPSASEYAFAAD